MKLIRIVRRALTLAIALLACSQADSRAPAAGPAGGGAMLSQRGKVYVRTQDGRQLELDVEIASDDESRALGLMYRKSMPETAGMIFVFPDERRHSFWMSNTLIPLDMLFIDSKGKIVGIVENAEPLTLTSRSVPADSLYVLEVNGGWSARHQVMAGDQVKLEGKYVLR